MYAAITGVLVGLSLTVDVARNHRVLWVVLDAVLAAYVCLWNVWARGMLLRWADQLTTLEKR
jgi:hypothetical protein